jgi:DNA-binding NarL/FixJ family response regulator
MSVPLDPAGQPGSPDQEPADDRKPCSCSDVHVTTREAEVLCALAGGSTSRQAAAVLRMSKRTVDTHVASMLRKTGASSRGELLALAVAHGIVDMSAGLPQWTGRFCLPALRSVARISTTIRP